MVELKKKEEELVDDFKTCVNNAGDADDIEECINRFEGDFIELYSERMERREESSEGESSSPE